MTRVPQQISDPVSENLAKLADLFPGAVKDGTLDVDALLAELGEFKEIQSGDETYELNWVGKQTVQSDRQSADNLPFEVSWQSVPKPLKISFNQWLPFSWLHLNPQGWCYQAGNLGNSPPRRQE